jgi:hypothetical protein
MKKKFSLLIIGILIVGTFFISTSTVTAVEKKERTINTGFKFGAFLLTSSEIEGLPLDEHMGGLSNVNITASCYSFMISTFPIWGTAMIEDETVTINLKMDQFLGLIDTRDDGYIDIMGICRNVAWEVI